MAAAWPGTRRFRPDGNGAGGNGGDGNAGELSGRAWLAALPDELAAQRRVMAALADRCEAWPLARSLVVGCSLGRGAADALSDIDAALGVDTERGPAGAERVRTAEAMVVAVLPELGALVDVLRHQTGATDPWVRRIFAQFADGTQLDLAVTAEAGIQTRRRGGGAPDFITLYQASTLADDPAPDTRAPAGRRPAQRRRAARRVRGDRRSGPGVGVPRLVRADRRRASTCAGARCGRPTTGCTRHAITSGRCGPRRMARCTRGTACPRCSTTTRRISRRPSSPPWPAWMPRTCPGPRGPAPRYSLRPARPPPGGTRPTSRRRWPPGRHPRALGARRRSGSCQGPG